MKMKIALDEGSTMPTRAHEHDAGLDLYANETAYIAPHTWVAVSTGTHAAVPRGFVGLLTSKSGLMAKHGLTCRGTIDAGYTGTIKAVIFNHSDRVYKVEKGQKVTQMVLVPIITPELELVDKLEETERGGQRLWEQRNMKTPEERAEEWARRKKIIYMREYRVKNRDRISRWNKDYYRRKKEEKAEHESET